MKISCEVVEDLIPLYVDGAASGESGRLVKEHTAECENCRRFLEEMEKESENFMSKSGEAVSQKTDGKPVMTDEVRAFLKLRRKLFLRKLAAVLAAVLCVSAVWKGWTYYYYERKTYLAWEDTGLYVKDNQLYATKTMTGRMMTIVAPNQIEEFILVCETAWAEKEYPSETINEKTDMNFEEQHNRTQEDLEGDDRGIPGLEKVYFVPPEAAEEALDLWNFETEEEGEEKTKALEEKCLLIWSWSEENQK